MSVRENPVISLLYPESEAACAVMSDVTMHDLGLDTIVRQITEDAKEQQMMLRVLGKMTCDGEVASYRQEVFEDLLTLPDIRSRLLELLGQIDYLKDYGTWRKSADEKPGLWDLMHRLDELGTYIKCVESLRDCLSDERISSRGLKDLRDFVDRLYKDASYEQMKKDINQLDTDASSIQSVTVGINVNSRFEAESLGLISVNSKPFKKSGIVSNFADAVASSDRLKNDSEWDGDMHYTPAEPPEKDSFIDKLDKTSMAMGKFASPMLGEGATMAKVPDGDGTAGSTFYLSNVASKMMSHMVRKLRATLSAYSDVSIITISKLIPELIYYIRFAEFIEKKRAEGFDFCKAVTCDGGVTRAEGFYNIKLASSIGDCEEIVDNDIAFDEGHIVYLLTGANRGGKTTLTQAVGQLFVLAQGGVYVPADKFTFTPVDMIFTHFPADEDKTMDLGRLGEECIRFREIFDKATDESLVLLNESFSTTSFEEGYYIAEDAVRALRHKNIRTIYNTHMHKLAADAPQLDVSSIVMQSDGGKRSYKVIEAAPEGSSYASDIARKYGVTYEMLTAPGD